MKAGCEIKNHAFFSDIDFYKLEQKQLAPPFVPPPAQPILDLEEFTQEPFGDVADQELDQFFGFTYVLPHPVIDFERLQI